MLFLPSPLFPRLHFPLPPTKFRVEERCTSRWKIRPCPAAPLIPEIMARATLDKSGKRGWYTRGSTSRRRRDLAPVIFFLGTDGARVRVPYVCRVYGTRRSWMGYTREEGEEEGWRGRGGGGGGGLVATHTTKNVDVERSEDWFAGRVPRRYAFYSFLLLFSSTTPPLLSSPPLSSTPRDVYLNRAFFHGWGRGGGDRRDGSFLEKGSRDNRVKLHLRVLWNGNKFPRGGSSFSEEERFEYFSMVLVLGLVFFFIGGRRIDEKSKEEFLISLRVELKWVILGIRRIFVPRDVLI